MGPQNIRTSMTKQDTSQMDTKKPYAHFPLNHRRFDHSILTPISIVFICMIMAFYTMQRIGNGQVLSYALVLLLMLVGSLALLVLTREFSARPETLFLIMFAFLCFFAAWAFPPFANADGFAQYYRAFQISQGKFFSSPSDITSAILPSNIVPTSLDGESVLVCIQRTWGDCIDFSTSSTYTLAGMGVYSPICFLPSAFGIKIATIISSNSWFVIYFARFANVLCVGLILYQAIKHIPYGKNLLMACSLFPMSLDVINSSSPDGLTIALCIALISFVLYHRENKTSDPLSWQQLAMLLFLMICVALTKIVYLPIVFVVFFLPSHRFSSQKRKTIVLCGFSCITVLLNLGWLFSVAGLTMAPGQVAVNPSEQIANIIAHPFGYLGVCINTTLINMESWLFTMVGESLGALNQAIPSGFIIALIGVTLVMLCFDNDCTTFNKREKAVLGIISFLVFGLILTSEYTIWTAVKASTIEGVQGRYFLPTLLLVLLAAKPHKGSVNNTTFVLDNIWIFYFCIDVCVLAAALMYVI